MNARSEHTERKTPSAAVSEFLIKNRIVLLVVLAVLFAGAIGTTLYIGITQSLYVKGFTKLDELQTALTVDNYEETAVAAAELAAKNPRNPVGARAFLMVADIRFSQKKWEEAKLAYLSAAKAYPKAYTAPVSYFNAAVCSEELGDFSGALDLYAQAAAAPNFPLASRALFNRGRIEDTQGNYATAVKIYDEAVSKFPSDQWAALAKSRSLALRAEGKSE